VTKTKPKTQIADAPNCATVFRVARFCISNQSRRLRVLDVRHATAYWEPDMEGVVLSIKPERCFYVFHELSASWAMLATHRIQGCRGKEIPDRLLELSLIG